MAPILLNHRERTIRNTLGSLMAMVLFILSVRCAKRIRMKAEKRQKEKLEKLNQQQEESYVRDTHSIILNGVSDDSCCFVNPKFDHQKSHT